MPQITFRRWVIIIMIFFAEPKLLGFHIVLNKLLLTTLKQGAFKIVALIFLSHEWASRQRG